MSKLMLIFGVLFLGLGIALTLLIYFSPGQMQILGLTAEVAAILLVGGPVILGLGGVIDTLEKGASASLVSEQPASGAILPSPATPKFTGFGKAEEKLFGDRAEDSRKSASTPGSAALSTSVAETISALEQAKTDIAAALGVTPAEATPDKDELFGKAQPSNAVPARGAESSEDGELYVVEEKVIRGRPARVLSDGTVEAETDEGWMRFENLEHLDEYLEAMTPEA